MSQIAEKMVADIAAGDSVLTREELTEKLVAKKIESGMKWSEIA